MRTWTQKSASIQPRTSPSKFGGKFNSIFTSLLNGAPTSADVVGMRRHAVHVRSEVNIELNFPPKLRGARSRLYRRRFLQVNTRWKALAEIYTMHSFAPFWNPLAKNGEKRAWPKQPRKGRKRENERPISSAQQAT